MLVRRLHRSFSTFVSKHFTVDESDLRRVVDAMNTQSRVSTTSQGSCLQLRECRLCDKANKSNVDNIWKLQIHKDGSYHCFRCSEHGSWFDLKKRVLGGKHISANSFSSAFTENDEDTFPENRSSTNDSRKVSPSAADQKTFLSHTSQLFNEASSNPTLAQRAKAARDYLKDNRKLDLGICQRYGVGLGQQQFPRDVRKSEVSTGSGSHSCSENDSSATESKSNIEWIMEDCLTFPWFSDDQSSGEQVLHY